MDESVPEQLDEFIRDVGGIFVPPDAKDNPAVMEIYENMMAGNCATCGTPLGKHTFAVFTNPIGEEELRCVMLFCGGACATDMQVMGWLQETYEDMAQRVQFRGGEGGN